MRMRTVLWAALVALAALSIPSRSEAANCTAGPNCPRALCWECIVDTFASCEDVPWSGRCTCTVAGGGQNCIMTGICTYQTCSSADGTGPCIWNAPPPSRRRGAVQPELLRPRSS